MTTPSVPASVVMNRLRLWLAIMGGLQTVSGGLSVLNVLPSKVVGVLVLILAGLHVGTALYVTPSPMLPAPLEVTVQGAVAVPEPVAPTQRTGDGR